VLYGFAQEKQVDRSIMIKKESSEFQNNTELPQKKVSVGLRSPNLFARRPALGWILFVVGILFFITFTINLYAKGPLLAVDKMISDVWPAKALSGPSYYKGAMNAGYFIGGQVVVALGIMLGIYFIAKRRWEELAMVGVGLVGSSALFLSLSNLIGRVRPPTQIWIIENIPGFPSGHAITVVVFYGLLAYFLVPKMRTGFGKAVVIASAILIMLYVGFSRIFTGGHYLTDVLAGYSLGIAWFGMAYGIIENYFKKELVTKLKHSKNVT
jgi:membrane-associated phospholipid phosphatase